MIQHTSRQNMQNPTAPARTPRLRLKPKASKEPGFVDGAWWPHSDDLAAELPDLLAVLSIRLGRVDRVVYNLYAWKGVPRKLAQSGRAVRLDGYRLQPRNTIEVLGVERDKVVLLVVPPRTDPTDAHTIMMTAAQPNNVDCTDGLLCINSEDRQRRTDAANAEDRWETEGGISLPRKNFAHQ